MGGDHQRQAEAGRPLHDAVAGRRGRAEQRAKADAEGDVGGAGKEAEVGLVGHEVVADQPGDAGPIQHVDQRRRGGDDQAGGGAPSDPLGRRQQSNGGERCHAERHAVQDVHADDFRPGIAPREDPQLQPEGEGDGREEGCALECGPEPGGRRQPLAIAAVQPEPERRAHQEQKDGRRHAADELRKNVDRVIVEIGAGEGIEQVPLQHDQDAQAPEPVQREHPVGRIHPQQWSHCGGPISNRPAGGNLPHRAALPQAKAAA